MVTSVRVRVQVSIAIAARTLCCLLCAAGVARAEAEAEAMPLLAEPVAYTDVIDAFEESDPLDVNVGLRYVRTDTSATVTRELIDVPAGRTRHVEIGKHELQRNELVLELDLGLHRDLMLTFRLPILLGEQQQLRPLSGNACAGGNSSDGCVALREPDATGAPLLELDGPIVSGRRSGLPSLELGLAWAVLNQFRSPEMPTWVLRWVTTIDTGALRAACTEGLDCDPGISRGTHQMSFETRVSRRMRYVEPYLGVSHSLEWLGAGESLFYPKEDRDSMVRADPPSTTEATLGTAIIPWEDRARQQRFEIDLQGRAATRSGGQDMSELFDALGASQSPFLGGGTPGFSGVTQVESHGRLGLDLRLLLHAARYVRFTLGASFTHVTAHLLTGARPCNASVSRRPGESRAGTCVEGVVNPLYRAVIDAPGQRFRVQDALSMELQAGATGRF